MADLAGSLGRACCQSSTHLPCTGARGATCQAAHPLFPPPCRGSRLCQPLWSPPPACWTLGTLSGAPLARRTPRPRLCLTLSQVPPPARTPTAARRQRRCCASPAASERKTSSAPSAWRCSTSRSGSAAAISSAVPARWRRQVRAAAQACLAWLVGGLAYALCADCMDLPLQPAHFRYHTIGTHTSSEPSSSP